MKRRVGGVKREEWGSEEDKSGGSEEGKSGGSEEGKSGGSEGEGLRRGKGHYCYLPNNCFVRYNECPSLCRSLSKSSHQANRGLYQMLLATASGGALGSQPANTPSSH